MWCLFVELGLLIYGIITLIKGEMKVGARGTLRGVSARVCGILLMVPLPVGHGGEGIYAANLALQRVLQGVHNQDIEELDKQEIQIAALIINGIALSVPLLLVGVIALTKAESEDKIRRDSDDEKGPDEGIREK